MRWVCVVPRARTTIEKKKFMRTSNFTYNGEFSAVVEKKSKNSYSMKLWRQPCSDYIETFGARIRRHRVRICKLLSHPMFLIAVRNLWGGYINHGQIFTPGNSYRIYNRFGNIATRFDSGVGFKRLARPIPDTQLFTMSVPSSIGYSICADHFQ